MGNRKIKFLTKLQLSDNLFVKTFVKKYVYVGLLVYYFISRTG